jgi:hypothetical protein
VQPVNRVRKTFSGCLINGQSNLFFPRGQTAEFEEKYYFCGQSAEAPEISHLHEIAGKLLRIALQQLLIL